MSRIHSAAIRPLESARCHKTACAMPVNAMFSDYLVFVDESGDHNLIHIDPQFPVFVLLFAVIHKDAYVNQVCPDLQRFKFEFWGHDEVVLHEHEIRKP